MKSITTHIFLAFIVLSSGCTEPQSPSVEISKINVSIFNSPEIKKFEHKITSPEDDEHINSFPSEQVESRTFDFSPELKSGDISIRRITWSPSATVFYVFPNKSRTLTSINNTQEFANFSWVSGFSSWRRPIKSLSQ
jgi:hypothetical protein